MISNGRRFSSSNAYDQYARTKVLRYLFFLFVIRYSTAAFRHDGRTYLDRCKLQFNFLSRYVGARRKRCFIFLGFKRGASFFFLAKFIVSTSPPQGFSLTSFCPRGGTIAIHLCKCHFFRTFTKRDLRRTSHSRKVSVLLIGKGPLKVILHGSWHVVIHRLTVIRAIPIWELIARIFHVPYRAKVLLGRTSRKESLFRSIFYSVTASNAKVQGMTSFVWFLDGIRHLFYNRSRFNVNASLRNNRIVGWQDFF